MAEQVGSLRIRLEASDAQFGKDLARARGKLQRFKRIAHDWRGTGTAFGGMAVALGGIASAAVRASTALNKGMANVATLIPQNTTRVQALKQSVRDLSVAHGKDAQDLASGLYQTISAFGDRAGRTMEILRINSHRRLGRRNPAATPAALPCGRARPVRCVTACGVPRVVRGSMPPRFARHGSIAEVW